MTAHRRTPRPLTRLVGAVAVLTLLAGCSGDAEPSSQPSQSAPESSRATVDPGRTSPENLPRPPKVRRASGAVKDVTLGECRTGKGRQQVTGEVTSSAKRRVDYLVTVSWITNRYDVMGLGYATLRGMSPGETRKFEISAKVAPGATQCTTNVQYGSVR